MFGDNLKRLRHEKGFSQNDIAEKLFVTRQCVSKWEKGVTQPDIEALKTLSDLLNVTVDELIKDGGGQNEIKPANKNNLLFIINILTAVFCMISFTVLWRFMPQTIPAHWTNGTIDRYGSRNEIFIHMITAAVFFAVDAVVFFTVKRIKDRKAIYIPHTIIILLQTAYLIFITVIYAIYINNIISFVTCMCACLIACISVAMHPKISGQNCFLGVRTAETLKSPEVWNKTNALSCYLFTSCSLIILTVNMSVIFRFAYLCFSVYAILAIIVIIYSKKISKSAQ